MATLVQAATRECKDRGYRGVVAYIVATNGPSLRIFRSAGFRVFGTIRIAKLFGQYRIFAGRGCKAFGFRVLSQAEMSRGAQKRKDPDRLG
jgi:L-amino acid N-acyltransferase YncA